MFKFTKGQIIFATVVLVASVLVAVVIVSVVPHLRQPRYVAIYLETGEIYFGSMRWFPSPRLSNVMFLQQTQEQGLQLDRFTNAVWQPQEPLYISRDKIVFWTYLAPTSPVVQAIEGRAPAAPVVPPQPPLPGDILVPPGPVPPVPPVE